MRAVVISISTSKARGDGHDTGGEALAAFATGLGAELAGRELITDDPDLIRERLVHWVNTEAELILTTGGTGFSPTDYTPEATRRVIEREAPGLTEAMRAASAEFTRHWMLSRAVAGICERSLIINFPGSPKSIAEAGGAIADALPHAVALITDQHSSHR